MDNTRVQPGLLSGALSNRAQDAPSSHAKNDKKGFDILLNQALGDKKTTPAKEAKQRRIARAKVREHALETKRIQRVRHAQQTTNNDMGVPVDRPARIQQIKDDLRRICEQAGLDPQAVDGIDFESLDDNTLEHVAKALDHSEESVLVEEDETEGPENKIAKQLEHLLQGLDASALKDLLTKIASVAGQNENSDEMGNCLEVSGDTPSNGKVRVTSDVDGEFSEAYNQASNDDGNGNISAAKENEEANLQTEQQNNSSAQLSKTKNEESGAASSAGDKKSAATASQSENNENKIPFAKELNLKVVATESVEDGQAESDGNKAVQNSITVENTENDNSAKLTTLPANETTKVENGKTPAPEKTTVTNEDADAKAAGVTTVQADNHKVETVQIPDKDIATSGKDAAVITVQSADKSAENNKSKTDETKRATDEKSASIQNSPAQNIDKQTVQGNSLNDQSADDVTIKAPQNKEITAASNVAGASSNNATREDSFASTAEKLIQTLKELGVSEKSLLQAAQATDLEDLHKKVGRWLENKNTARLSEYLKGLPLDQQISLAAANNLSAETAELFPALKMPGTLWEVFRRRAENPEAFASETINFAHTLADKATDKSGLSSTASPNNSPLVGASKLTADTVPGADQTAMIDRIANITAMSVGKKINRISLELTPPDLGKLQINLALKNGLLHATLKTETPAAHQILQANLDTLKDSLAQQGVQVAKLELSFQDERQQQGWQENRFMYQEQQDRQRGNYQRERNYSGEERTVVELENASPALVGANSLNVVI